MRIAKEGIPFVIISFLLGLVFLALSYFGFLFYIFAILSFVFGSFSVFFFRDPTRQVSDLKSFIISPADGKVMEITSERGLTVVRIFLSVFNVHLQRSPVSGEVVSVEYKKGKFLPAMDKMAHSENEQNIVIIKNTNGFFEVKQIAGIIARRIICYVRPGQIISVGDKIGLIKFGSQVDICMPNLASIKVQVGDKVIGAKTIIGEIVQ